MSIHTDNLVDRARQHGTPLIDGDTVTFVWLGGRAPTITGDFTHWHRGTNVSMEPAGLGAWAATLTLPRDAYLEYAFLLDGERFHDPLNPNQVDDGMGHGNSFFWMPAAVDTPLARPQPGVPVGRVSEHAVTTLGHVVGETRMVYLYQPPVAEPCPLLVVLDGQDYYHKAHLPTIMDNLIAERRLRPLALALVASSSVSNARRVEYTTNDAHLAFLLDVVVPLAQRELILSEPGRGAEAWGLLGASMGGLTALYAGLRAPEVFGNVLSESGAFGADLPEYRLYHRSVIEDLLDLMPPPAIRVWMDCGLHEWFITPNRRMYPRLKALGYDVTYHEHTSGHNYPSWRNVVWRGLIHLFGVGGI